MLTREGLFNRINYLVPDAKFVFWNINDIEGNNGYESPYSISDIQDWRIVWYPENNNPIPSLNDLLAISEETISAYVLQKQKEARNERYSTNLGVIAGYQSYKVDHSEATFSEYLDTLEEIRNNM